jgi:hypothetical protein
MNIYTKGEIIKCLRTGGYYNIKEGHIYVVQMDTLAHNVNVWVMNSKNVAFGYPIGYFKSILKP